MRRWYQALGASLLALVLTRSMTATGWDDPTGSDGDRDGSDSRPTTPAPVIVANPEVTTPRGSTFLGGRRGSDRRAGRRFDTDWKVDGEPAWLSYLAGDPDQGRNDREEDK